MKQLLSLVILSVNKEHLIQGPDPSSSANSLNLCVPFQIPPRYSQFLMHTNIWFCNFSHFLSWKTDWEISHSWGAGQRAGDDGRNAGDFPEGSFVVLEPQPVNLPQQHKLPKHQWSKEGRSGPISRPLTISIQKQFFAWVLLHPDPEWQL